MDWTSAPDRTEHLRRFYALKQHPLLTDSFYCVRALSGEILRAVHRGKEYQLIGIFSLKGNCGLVNVEAPDGIYPNLADGGSVEVKFGRMSCQGNPIIFGSQIEELTNTWRNLFPRTEIQNRTGKYRVTNSPGILCVPTNNA